MRAFIAIAVAVLTIYALLAILSPAEADLALRLLERWLPIVDAGTVAHSYNQNTDDRGDLLMAPLALAAGLVAGALV